MKVSFAEEGEVMLLNMFAKDNTGNILTAKLNPSLSHGTTNMN